MSAVIDMSETATLGKAQPLRGRWLEQSLRWLVEIPAAIAVVAEVIILFAGIVARGVFHRPIIWSDELASILFLWLAMLGSAIAVQRSAHMRLTFFTSYLSPRVEAWASTPPRAPSRCSSRSSCIRRWTMSKIRPSWRRRRLAGPA